MEPLLAALVFGGAAIVAIVPLVRSGLSPRRRLAAIGTYLVAGFTAVAMATALHRPAVPERDVTGRPIAVEPEGFVSSGTCRACHPDQYASWDASYHQSMTQVATPETVIGEFDDVELRIGDWRFFLERRGDEFWVDMPELDWSRVGSEGQRVQRKIEITTGSHHMQAYWYSSGNTRVLGLLPFVFNVELQEWMPRNSAFLQTPQDEPFSEVGRWNKICLECHVVQGRLRPVEPRGQDTHVAEFGIACEACHGPGAEHVEANRSFVRRYAAHLGDGRDSTIVQPEHLSHERSSEVCGQCHSTSIWTSQEAIDSFMVDGFRYRAGDRLADTKDIIDGRYEDNPPEIQAVLSFQREFVDHTFWPDGMNRVAGREYNGLIETPCFERGEMSCLSCHVLHKTADDPRTTEEWADDQLQPGMRGNLACTQCHESYLDDATLRAHTHHEPARSGSLCYNCHMSHSTYGLLKAIRSHQVDSPSVSASVTTGRINACNQCHLDKTMAWTAGHLSDWYQIRSPVLAADDEEVAAAVLHLLKGDAGQRALSAWSMGWEPALEASGRDWQGLYLAAVLTDPYPAVRHIARRSLLRLPGFEAFDYDSGAPADVLARSRVSATETWAGSRVSDRRAGRARPIGVGGLPDMGSIRRLLDQRDDRPINLAE